MLKTNEKILKNFYDDTAGKRQPFYRAVSAITALLIVCCALPALAVADTVSSEHILAAIEKKYSGKSFKAAFVQKSTLSALGLTETASGNAFFSHPGKMKWQYLTPDTHEIITNGEKLWIFRPAQNQVMTGNAKEFFKAGSGGAFLSDISLVRKNFDIKTLSEDVQFIELELIPKINQPEIASIGIIISKKDTMIQKVTTRNIYKDTMEFEFSNIEFTPIDPGLFEFTVPKGTSIIKMN